MEGPEKIGRYEVRADLGRGPLGVVYEAFDPDLERVVAVKTMSVPAGLVPRERELLEARFFAEARLAARLSHPGIVKIHETGRTDAGLLYMVLEHPQGPTLAELLQGGPLAWRTALHVVAGVADALDYAHGKGVIHHDIKPQNIMVLPDGEAKVLDFGIARVESACIRLTMSGQSIGAPLYMSPEQALGMPVDHRIDLFALGAVLYQTLTGRLAFGADTPGRIIAKVILDDPAPPSTLVSGLHSDADYVVARALAKDPEYRYGDGREMADDVTDVLAGRPPRHRETWVPPDAGPPPRVTEEQLASLRRGAFLPPAVEDSDEAEDLWALNIHRSVGGTMVSTARHRPLPSSPRKPAPEPPPVRPEPTAAPVPPPASLADFPTLVPVSSSAPPPPASTADVPTLVGIPAFAPPPASTADVPTLVGIPAFAPPRPSSPQRAPASESLKPAKPTRKTRNVTGMAVAVAGLVAGVGIGALAVAMWKPGLFVTWLSTTPPVDLSAPSPTTPSSPPAPEAPPSAMPAPEESAVNQNPVAAPEPTPSPAQEAVMVPQADASPTPTPSKKPRRRTVRPSPSPAATSPAPRYAKLAIDFEHPLEEGTLRVWVDDELMLDEDLDSQKTKKILVFKGRKGSLAQVLAVLPGEHEIRVEVAWEDNVKTKRISGTFEADATRRLSAKVGGLLKKGLSVKWE